MKELKGIYTIWLRDVKRFWRDKPRIVGAIAQPALFLFVLGTGLGGGLGKAFAHGGFIPGVEDYVVFIYPGIIGMTLLFTSVFSALSIVWDREFGFLKEVLVAPISRSAVALGKALGGATVALFQGTLMLVFAPLIGVSLTFAMVIKLLILMFLVSLSLTSMGIVIAARMRSMEGFHMIVNFLTLPMFFLSGAMFPVRGLPSWMDYLVRINPLTYGVDILRYTVIGFKEHSISGDLLVAIGFGLVMICLGVFEFNRQE
ncbi:MAG: ABC transporter permease [Actinomycetota bacterium]|nr:ABC transporter permease [Actinomycetota bacterium]